MPAGPGRAPHGPYIDAVVAAFGQADIDVSGIEQRDDPHRCATIRLRPGPHWARSQWWQDSGDPVVSWSEVDGWAVRRGSPLAEELIVALLAAPSTVAIAVGKRVGVSVAPPTQRRYPEVDFRDHDGRTPNLAFEDALARYVRSDEPPHPPTKRPRDRWPW